MTVTDTNVAPIAVVPMDAATTDRTLRTVTECAWSLASARENAIAAVRAASPLDQRNVKLAFQAGYMARRMNPTAADLAPDMIAEAVRVLSAVNATATKVADGARQRTADEEKFYGAARVAWYSILEAANVTTTETRGKGSEGNTTPRTRNKADATVKPDAKPEAPAPDAPAAVEVVAKVKTLAEGHNYLRTQAATMLAFVNKNVRGFDPAAKAAVKAFADAIAAIPVID